MWCRDDEVDEDHEEVDDQFWDGFLISMMEQVFGDDAKDSRDNDDLKAWP